MRAWVPRILIFCLAAGAVAALTTICLVSCSSAPQPPNILFICVDTLRPDRLGYTGYDRPTSPVVDSLAAGGRVFSHAYSQAGWTLPAMATIMTGRYPQDHHAIDFHFGLDRDLPTLASILARRGYDTRAYVSHVLLTPQYGFDKGFDRFDYSLLDRGDPHKISTSKELTDLALADLDDVDEPYFVWIHYFDPHFDYLPYVQWESFGDSDSDRYDQEIAYTDHYIGRLLSRLDEKGMLENTAIVFTADHGEEFGEHGGIYHYTCYDEVLRVPLIIKAPSVAPGINSSRVDQVDLFTTMLALAGVQPREAYPGRDLLADDLVSRPLFVTRDRPPGFRQRAIIHGDIKLFRIEPSDTTLIPEGSRSTHVEVTNVIPGVYMFDLQRDPQEENNLYPVQTAAADELLARLASQFTSHDIPAERIGVDEELRAKLRALGYIR